MWLSRTISQKIVIEMMDVVPYNINVMDEHGVIIGSGDITRIGAIHEGAIKAIKEKHIIEIYEESTSVKLGVNEPIIIDDKLIGVIGITGNPDEVRPFSKLVRVAATLLIEQSRIDEEIHNKKLNKQKFYYELTYRKIDYDNNFYEIAKSYGIDLTKGCQAILIDGNIKSKDLKLLCSKYPHYSEIGNRLVFFITYKEEYNDLIKKLRDIKDIYNISIGPKEGFVAISLEKAELALEIGKKIKPSSLVYDYDEFRLFISLSHENKEVFTSLIYNLDKSGKKLELIETVQAYIEENGDINNVANKLKIHRNTLNYRLERITQLTGKNPKKLLDLFELICGFIWR
ncbi:MAG: sugar diacid recognition domain-containing protein [Clostridium perfringens]|nr:sugar diacid recognition domain-containing protein [Clostridium perfringens]